MTHTSLGLPHILVVVFILLPGGLRCFCEVTQGVVFWRRKKRASRPHQSMCVRGAFRALLVAQGVQSHACDMCVQHIPQLDITPASLRFIMCFVRLFCTYRTILRFVHRRQPLIVPSRPCTRAPLVRPSFFSFLAAAG